MFCVVSLRFLYWFIIWKNSVWPLGHIFFSWGWIGVDLFFVLSGFFISLSVIVPSSWSFLNFIKRRFLRIAPPYYVSMIIIMAISGMYFLTTSNGLYHSLSHFLFLHSYSPQTHGSINGAYWSLGVEFSFYILIGLSAAILRQKKRAGYILIGAVIFSWLWRTGCFLYIENDAMQRFIWSTQVFGMLDEFAIGVSIALIYTHVEMSKLFRHVWLPFVLLFAGLGMVIAYVLHAVSVNYWFDYSTMVFSRTFLALGFGMIILSFIGLEKYDLFIKACRWSGLCFVGTISFSIYLYHLPIIQATVNVKDSVGSINAISLSVIFMTMLVAWGSYIFVESRFMRTH
ncbi:acyltransferase family protein [Aeromonas veronii]|uniref:acyltransferase family protein n=1 Tax=Aeromonas veronii TaxID=654 RepID=UPI00244473AA|nr:acyltransferase [Aeromonas veronii]